MGSRGTGHLRVPAWYLRVLTLCLWAGKVHTCSPTSASQHLAVLSALPENRSRSTSCRRGGGQPARRAGLSRARAAELSQWWDPPKPTAREAPGPVEVPGVGGKGQQLAGPPHKARPQGVHWALDPGVKPGSNLLSQSQQRPAAAWPPTRQSCPRQTLLAHRLRYVPSWVQTCLCSLQLQGRAGCLFSLSFLLCEWVRPSLLRRWR